MLEGRLLLRSISSFAGALTLTVLSVLPCSAQGVEGVPSESFVAVSTAVSGGQLGGSVYDAVSGEPVPRASVVAGGRGTFSDSAGLFLVPAGTSRATIEAIGYETIELALPSARPGAGWVARIAMKSSAVSFPCEGVFTYGVVAEVRDALTGRAPHGSVVLHARQDSLEGFEEATADPEDESLVLVARLGAQAFGPHGRPQAPIEAELTADGYAPWTQTGIRIEPGRCGGGTKRFQVWLLPTEQARRPTPSNKR